MRHHAPPPSAIGRPAAARPRATHAARLFRVKRPAESRVPWNCHAPERTVPGEQAFRPMAEDGCALVR